ncbi:hypothetical protein Zm00014a_010841 [Zea mays]|uniref:Uncharacterized protein n=1 Tax=Zea mays TaxID=4577 RepID=A0A3L6FQ86_MAIZE|nr:hypothetical protein Zm00014a_010841 [Zea mays]
MNANAPPQNKISIDLDSSP